MANPPVWSLDDIADNFFREGGRSPDTETLTYGFPTQVPGGYSKLSGEGKGFFTFGLEQRSWAEAAIEAWEDVIDIDFVNLGSSDSGNIEFMNTNTNYAGSAHAKGPPGDNKFGDIWVHADVVSNFDLGYGKVAVKTLIHEIGHTLGLQHPGNYDASDSNDPTYEDDAPYEQDSHQYTIMSYFSETETGADHDSNPQTPLLHDIWAAQQRYGANMTTRTGNTIYGFGSTEENSVYDFTVNTEPALAIWDAGGIDELSLSEAGLNVKIDLRPGHFTSALGGTDNIAIAYNCWIENAHAGSGFDTVIGNDLDNVLRGGEGGDDLWGEAGDDKLYAGDGNDYLKGEEGNDTIDGAAGEDDLFGWTGNDDLSGGDDDDRLYGWGGEDILRGGDGDDYLSGNTGNDIFFGDAGFDTASFLYSDSSWFVELAPEDGPPSAEANGSGELLMSIEGVEMGDGNDVVHGSNIDNSLEGGGGNDRLYAYGGDNTVDGGDGDDVLFRSGGNNVIIGGAGIDEVRYGATDHAINLSLHNQFSGQVVVDKPGTSNDQRDFIKKVENVDGTVHNDTIFGSFADNLLDGGSGNDQLVGYSGDDELFGGYGDDLLRGGADNDELNGGIAIDTVTYEDGWSGVTVDLAITGAQAIANLGSDTLIGIENLIGSDFADQLYGNGTFNELSGGNGGDRLFGRNGDDTLDGANGRDLLEGGSGNDSLSGGENDDTMRGGTGDDRISGGDGADMVDYADSASFIRVDLAINGEQDIGFSQGRDTLISIEYITGSSLSDTLRGNSGANKFWGLGGNDKIEGRSGNDIIDGGLNYDTASYESATSGVSVNLSNALPQNTLGAGIDSLISIEALLGSRYADILAGDLVGNHISGGDGDDWLFGGEGDDWISGDDGNDLVFGGDDDDTLSGGYDGTDIVSYLFATAGVTVTLATTSAQNTGGAGSDRLYFFENLDGSLFDDSLTGSSLSNVINGFDGADEIAGQYGNDTLSGGNGFDTIDAGSGADVVDGGLGLDEMDGGDGVDTLDVRFWNGAYEIDLETGATNYAGETAINFENVMTGDGDDVIDGWTGANLIQSAGGDDTMRGGDGGDTLEGGEGSDELRGGNGLDTIRGGRGTDFLFGQAGNDTFRFRSEQDAGATAANRDTIEDFVAGHDRIDLMGIDANASTPFNNAFSFIGQSGFSGAAGELRYAVGASSTTVSGDTDGDGAADFALRLIGHHTLTTADFIL